MVLASRLVRGITLCGCGMQRRESHWVSPWRGTLARVWSVSFSPDGTRIASGSHDKTVRVWNAVTVQPFSQPRDSDPSTFSLHPCTPTQGSCIIPPNTCNDHLISFSSKLEHALLNSADLLEPTSHHDSNSTPFLLQGDGWMMGPNHQLIFWVPPGSRHPFYTPGTAMVIPRGGVELDLSRMAHGTRWSSCRDASTQG
ncbi:uncharacterized protein EDB93DRAFT_640194 [Suillus bovinus]|uniref:uncharacterized protein n=1 Tax=Suillus bovinus TaxID=48563 RepID=UPI001B86D664|nr:uncharacterized protein EDB93DRAFT_640194 [Suillus bovinus]KAG2141161.1 hypothetical protein EDB93DRAFT_640194 [Suillus bovinus]